MTEQERAYTGEVPQSVRGGWRALFLAPPGKIFSMGGLLMRKKKSWPFFVVVILILVAAYFRLHHLAGGVHLLRGGVVAVGGGKGGVHAAPDVVGMDAEGNPTGAIILEGQDLVEANRAWTKDELTGATKYVVSYLMSIKAATRAKAMKPALIITSLAPIPRVGEMEL